MIDPARAAGSRLPRRAPFPGARRRLRSAISLGAVLLTMAAADPSRAAWRQTTFQIGAYAVFDARPDPARIELLNDAGLDWANCYSENQLVSARRLDAMVDSLRKHRRGFVMKDMLSYRVPENGPDRFDTNAETSPNATRIRGSLEPRAGLNRSGTAGYTVWDEPCDERSFANLSTIAWLIDTCAVCASRLAYVNLLGIGATDRNNNPKSCWYQRFGPGAGYDKASGYAAYLRAYLSLYDSRPHAAPVLSFDDYPFQIPDTPRHDWFQNLRIVRDVVAQFGRKGRPTPWWVVVQLSPFHCPPHACPADTFPRNFGFANTRWQIYTALAYGAKGISYWLATPFSNPAEVWGPGLIREDGDTVAVVYSQVRQLDHDLHELGPTLMKLDAVAAIHGELGGATGIDDESIDRTPRIDDLVASFSGTGAEDAMAGHLRDRTNGNDYLLIVNKSLSSSRAFRIRLSRVAGSVTRISRVNGHPLPEKSKVSSFTTPVLAPGQGELYRIGGSGEAPNVGRAAAVRRSRMRRSSRRR